LLFYSQWKCVKRNLLSILVVHVDKARLYLSNAANRRPIVHPPRDMRVWRATVEWYWQGKTKNSGRCLSQCYFVHHKAHTDWPRPSREKSATNHLSHGTA
jgi:hypothetical protein